jgi:hypothetical protein
MLTPKRTFKFSETECSVCGPSSADKIEKDEFGFEYGRGLGSLLFCSSDGKYKFFEIEFTQEEWITFKNLIKDSTIFGT